MPLLTPQTTNAIYNSTNYNANLAAIEGGFQDIGNYVCTGLLPSIGSGLSVNVSSGTAILGGHQAIASGVISGLANNTLNHLWIVQNLGATIFSSNTTGIAPANSAKLGTATTAGGVVTSVNTGRTSGRQQFVQPQALIPGGPAAGLTSAGHPDGLDLSKWGATDAEGQTFFGVLPAGAGGSGGVAASTANVFTNQNTFSQVPAATANHGVVNIGSGGFAGGGGGNFVGLAAGTQLAINSAAGFTGELIGAQVGGVTKLYLDYQGTYIAPGPGPGATTALGLFSVGAGPFDGSSSGHFTGNGSGTQIAGNAPSGYNGNLIDLQVFGVPRFSVGATGLARQIVNDAAASATLTALQVAHQTTATPANFIGVQIDLQVPNSTPALVTAGSIYGQLSSVTAGAEFGTLGFLIPMSGTPTEGLKLQPNGAKLQVRVVDEFRHIGATFAAFNATPVTQPSSTTDIRLALISLGFLATGGASPLNLNGGALTAGTTTLSSTTVTGLSTAQVTKTTTYTATATDFTIFCDTTTAAFTVTLPTAASVPGKIFCFKRTDVSAHNLTIAAAGGDNTEGAGFVTISGGLASMWLQSNGVNTWWAIKP